MHFISLLADSTLLIFCLKNKAFRKDQWIEKTLCLFKRFFEYGLLVIMISQVINSERTHSLSHSIIELKAEARQSVAVKHSASWEGGGERQLRLKAEGEEGGRETSSISTSILLVLLPRVAGERVRARRTRRRNLRNTCKDWECWAPASKEARAKDS